MFDKITEQELNKLTEAFTDFCKCDCDSRDYCNTGDCYYTDIYEWAVEWLEEEEINEILAK